MTVLMKFDVMSAYYHEPIMESDILLTGMVSSG